MANFFGRVGKLITEVGAILYELLLGRSHGDSVPFKCEEADETVKGCVTQGQPEVSCPNMIVFEWQGGHPNQQVSK